MTRNEIIKELKTYFKLQEFVCPDVYKKYGERAWDFLDTSLLHVILVLRRDILKCSMVINDWSFGGRNTQRGLRCNTCALVKGKSAPYLSQHIFGKAIDCVSSKMSASTMRRLIHENEALLPCNVRVEADVTWLHIDVMPTPNEVKVYEFKA